MPNFRIRILVELSVLLFFAVVHVVPYLHFSRAQPAQAIKASPIFITLVQPKPKPKPPEPKPLPKIVPPKVVEPPKPKKVTPPKPPKPPKVVKKTPKPVIPKTKPMVEQPQRVVEKPKLQQESPIKVQAEEVVEKEVAEKPQQLSEPEVKKPEPEAKPKSAEKPVESAPEAEPEPVHEPVITKVTGIAGCTSTLNNYPAEAREQGVEGTVKVKVQVLADGSVDASIVKSSGSDILDNSVLEHVRDCNLEPAEKNGVPMKSSVIIPVRFRLDN